MSHNSSSWRLHRRVCTTEPNSEQCHHSAGSIIISEIIMASHLQPSRASPICVVIIVAVLGGLQLVVL